MREGCEAAQLELNEVEEEVEEVSALKDREICSLQGVLDELDYKVSVATNECAKWTDNTLQIVQYVTTPGNNPNSCGSEQTHVTIDQLL